MKTNLTFIALMLLFAGCSSTGSNAGGADIAVPIADVLHDVSNLEDWTEEHKNPIEAFTQAAENQAAKTIKFGKSNIEKALAQAKEYEHCFIAVENHTLVRIADMEDCKQSGAWSACMPFAEGYIQKGDLQHQEDYINNIIGTPDGQERVMYLFEE